MSLRLKQLSGRDVAAILVRPGFEVVATRGGHCKLRRPLPSGERQTLVIPLHPALATGTVHAIYRQACRFIPEVDLQAHVYTGAVPKRAPAAGQLEPERRGTRRKEDKGRRAKATHGRGR